MAELYPTVWMDPTSVSIHPLVVTGGSFHLLVAVSNAAMTTGVQDSV